ncbi:hypothetical protein ACFVYP_22350 [Kitasatospora sp. NPDC058201]|uniref:hypothetical protein n=1 Tax=unclassified Kitasatospora TaxID=2633591 RepID=UPI0036495EBE
MLIATNERGHVVKHATKPAIGTMLANLRRGNAHMVVERVDGERSGDWYIQVLLCENNTYQLEYRNGVAEQHFQTLTVSQEKVLTALLGWAAAKPGWQDGFMWNNIGEQFSSKGHAAPESTDGMKQAAKPRAV